MLILGGTSEAAALAEALASQDDLHVINSLAGRTRSPRLLPGEVRIGGFGGVRGLIAFLEDRGINAVVDATHPFATAMSAHADMACRHFGIPRLHLTRPSWPRHPDDRWIEVADTKAAASSLPRVGRRVFLTSGHQDLEAFAELDDVWFLVRTVEPIRSTKPRHFHWLQAKGPFTEADELALFIDHRIDVLVTKASGGKATYPKVAAARTLHLPVIMIKRPRPPNGPSTEDIPTAVTWLRRQVTG
ncbi:MAG: cobalt-precorrin-6A reductase [Geminicoccaceae bacterium]